MKLLNLGWQKSYRPKVRGNKPLSLSHIDVVPVEEKMDLSSFSRRLKKEIWGQGALTASHWGR
jgi:acetylornithine deacetylase/succinyl-diaminopimelate desuccinylase-like protein